MQRPGGDLPRRAVRARLVLAALALLAGCRGSPLAQAPDDEAVLGLRAPTGPVFAGKPVQVQVTAWWTSGRDATGEVALAASAGAFDAARVTLAGGAARATWTCPAEDPACAGTVHLDARWEDATASATLLVLPLAADSGHDAGAVDAGAADAGAPGDASVDDPRLADAGFRCDGWDGGPHPGYTDASGQPLAVGCFGEPIDYVPLASPSPTATHVCGTVELTQPVTEPVILHGLFTGVRVAGPVTQCCAEPRCLRDPRRITFRFDVEEMKGRFGLGVKWNARTQSQFGFYDGTVAAPILDLANARWLDVPAGSGVISGVDFGIGPGWRP